MADEQPNWRYYVAFDEVFDDPNAPFASNTEAAHRGIDAVVAAVQKDDAKHLSEYRRALIRTTRQVVARDIRAAPVGMLREYFARIAEGSAS